MKLIAAALFVLPALALASPAVQSREGDNTCKSGPVQCCDISNNGGWSSPTGSSNCYDFILGDTCKGSTVCCESVNNFIGIGCIPISL